MQGCNYLIKNIVKYGDILLQFNTSVYLNEKKVILWNTVFFAI